VESGEDNKVVFRSAEPGFSVTVQGAPVDEYPTLPDYEPTRGERVPSAGLYRALKAVLHAASKDETRYNLNGVMVDADGEPTVRCVATDGHRLCVADAGPVSLPWSGQVIIPARAVKLLLPLMFKSPEVCLSQVGKPFQTITISGDGWSVAVRTIEGEFPNYHQVIPRDTAETVQVNRAEFVEAVSSMIAVAPERSHAVKFTINGDIVLEVNNPDLGYASTRCECDRASGQPEIAVAFNGKYILDALKELDAPKIQFAFKDEISPVRFTEQHESHPLCVVMPMRV
jgi:DNA polymerase-3 subunit beta